jgi:23S rRNA (guanine745-N1)-methyltransferase
MTIQGDTAAMIDARDRFLRAGHYDPIVDALIAAAPLARTVVDIGAGTGHYLAAVLDSLPKASGLALDVSVPALERAAHAHPHIEVVQCDVWREIPLADDSADLMLNVFAPRNPTEMRRVLEPTGTLLVVTPTRRHLHELQLIDVHPGKRARLHADLGRPAHSELVEFTMDLGDEDVEALIGMGPNAHHDVGARGARRVTASVVLEAYRG